MRVLGICLIYSVKHKVLSILDIFICISGKMQNWRQAQILLG